MHALDPLFSSKSSNLYKWLNDFYRLLFSFRPYDTTTSSLNTYLSSEHLFSLKVLKPLYFDTTNKKFKIIFMIMIPLYLSIFLSLPRSSSCQVRRQDFDWGGALRILTRAKVFSALPQILAPHPNWQIGEAFYKLLLLLL